MPWQAYSSYRRLWVVCRSDFQSVERHKGYLSGQLGFIHLRQDLCTDDIGVNDVVEQSIERQEIMQFKSYVTLLLQNQGKVT